MFPIINIINNHEDAFAGCIGSSLGLYIACHASFTRASESLSLPEINFPGCVGGWLEKAEIKPTQPSWSLSWG